MLPINEYQQKIFTTLKNNISKAKVYDDVPKKTKLPIIIVGDYGLSNGLVKKGSYIITQSIDIYSEYEGKKEINTLVAEVINLLEGLFNVNISEEWCITGVSIGESSVGRSEDIYIANLKFDFEIEENF